MSAVTVVPGDITVFGTLSVPELLLAGLSPQLHFIKYKSLRSVAFTCVTPARVFQAVAVDVKTRSVTFEDGLRMEYRKLFIATGSK